MTRFTAEIMNDSPELSVTETTVTLQPMMSEAKVGGVSSTCDAFLVEC